MIVAQLIGWLLPVIASVAIAFWMRHRMYADDNNWFECFWNALVAGVTTLWNALLHGLMWVFAFETMYRISLIQQWAKEREYWTPDIHAMLAHGIERDEPVDIDYEQPMTMYPELPEMEYES